MKFSFYMFFSRELSKLGITLHLKKSINVFNKSPKNTKST